MQCRTRRATRRLNQTVGGYAKPATEQKKRRGVLQNFLLALLPSGEDQRARHRILLNSHGHRLETPPGPPA